MKTIAKNRVRFITELLGRATNGKLYTLNNGFTGEDVTGPSFTDPYGATLRAVLSGQGVLKQDGPIHYHVRYHSNHWMTFEAPNPAATPLPAP